MVLEQVGGRGGCSNLYPLFVRPGNTFFLNRTQIDWSTSLRLIADAEEHNASSLVPVDGQVAPANPESMICDIPYTQTAFGAIAPNEQRQFAHTQFAQVVLVGLVVTL